MKTIEEWFQGLTETQQDYIKRTANGFDVNIPGYFEFNKDLDADKILSFIARGRLDSAGSTNTERREANLFLVYSLNKCNKELLSDDMFITYLDNTYYDASYVRKYLSKEIYLKLLESKYSRYGEGIYDLDQLLISTEDFDNINWNKLKNSSSFCNEELFGIMGREKAKEWLKEHPAAFDIYRDEERPLIDELFDELFFGENGWCESDKKVVVRRYAAHQYRFDDLLKRVICVDKKYYKYIYPFIENRTAMANEIYTAKKSEEELTGNETVEQVYRYSKEIRKLAQIAACCVRGNISKAMTGTLAEVAGLMKIYQYDFDKIFACMYPETIEDDEEECQEA